MIVFLFVTEWTKSQLSCPTYKGTNKQLWKQSKYQFFLIKHCAVLNLKAMNINPLPVCHRLSETWQLCLLFQLWIRDRIHDNNETIFKDFYLFEITSPTSFSLIDKDGRVKKLCGRKIYWRVVFRVDIGRVWTKLYFLNPNFRLTSFAAGRVKFALSLVEKFK